MTNFPYLKIIISILFLWPYNLWKIWSTWGLEFWILDVLFRLPWSLQLVNLLPEASTCCRAVLSLLVFFLIFHMSTFVKFILAESTDFRQSFTCFSLTLKTDLKQDEWLDRAFKALSNLEEMLGWILKLPEINKVYHFWVATQIWCFTHIFWATCGLENLSTTNCLEELELKLLSLVSVERSSGRPKNDNFSVLRILFLWL